MLSNVQSVWFNASNAIAQALENLDAEVNAPREDEQDDAQHQSGVDQLKNELETYKKLLDDAQMQHFELSKQSRLLLGEKDVEIQCLKQRFGVVDEPVSPTSPKKSSTTELPSLSMDSAESNLLFQKILSEKIVLESSLQEAEMKLRDSLREKNDLKVIRKNYDELNQRFDIVRNDYTQLKAEFEIKEKQKNETIENLVQEYSRLAADAELQQQKQADRIAEVMRENEVLVTKMHALEHSISELADRSSSPTKSSTHSGEVDQVSQQELKEAKAKVLNLQFDLKERHDEIDKLKATVQSLTEAASASAAANAATAAAAANSNVSQVVEVVDPAIAAELSQVKVVLLQKEKELEELLASKAQQDSLLLQYSTDIAKLKEEQTATEDKLKVAQAAMASAGNDNASAMQSVQQELEQSKTAMKALETSFQKLEQDMKDKLTLKNEEIEQLKKEALANMESTQADVVSKYETQIAALNQKESTLQQELKQYQEELEALKTSSTANSNTLQETVDRWQKKAEEVEQQFQQSKTDHEKQLLALSANDESSRQALIQQYVDTIEALEKTIKEKESEMEAMKQSFEAEKKSLEEDLKAKHAEELFTEVAAEKEQAQALLRQTQQEHQEAVSKLNEDIAALQQTVKEAEKQVVDLKEEHIRQLNDALVNLKKELEDLHSDALQQELTKANEAAEKKLSEELQQQAEGLDTKFQEEKSVLTTQLSAEKEEALRNLTVEKETEKVDALNALTNQKQEELEKALADLDAKKTEEHNVALTNLTTEKDAERQTAVEAVEQASQAKEESLKAQHDQEVASLQADIAAVKQELEVVEDKYKLITKEAVDAMEQKKNEEMQLALIALRAEMQGLVDQAFADRDEHLANYTKERLLRKKIHNKLLEIQGNIRVICRVRPILEVERRSGEDVDVTEIPNDEELIIQRDAVTRSKYDYDRVFGQTSSQEEVFDAVQPLCVSVLDGYNVCIFAYGQTGSGKTFTMEGYGENIGVSPRAIAEVFKQIENMKDHWTFTMQLSILEIYNETIRDLLDDSQKNNNDKLEIRQTPEGNQVPGLTEILVSFV